LTATGQPNLRTFHREGHLPASRQEAQAQVADDVIKINTMQQTCITKPKKNKKCPTYLIPI
jgi:hypothetical protein